MNEKKATGPDDIPAKFIRMSSAYICTPLTHIINLSLKTSRVPDQMKVARVLALYKNKGSKISASNYRLISILPIFSKILEKTVNCQLQNHLLLNSTIFSNQYGFQKNKGTADALIEFSNNCFSALNDSNSILGTFIDFSKAFDTVNHDILLLKLKIIYNFSDTAILWFKDYLANRNQYVQIVSNKSPKPPVQCGVPQGSMILYINDLMLKTNSFQPILFADGTNLFYKSRNLNNEVQMSMQIWMRSLIGAMQIN